MIQNVKNQPQSLRKYCLTVALSRTLMEFSSATFLFRRASCSVQSGRVSHFPKTTRSMSLSGRQRWRLTVILLQAGTGHRIQSVTVSTLSAHANVFVRYQKTKESHEISTINLRLNNPLQTVNSSKRTSPPPKNSLSYGCYDGLQKQNNV